MKHVCKRLTAMAMVLICLAAMLAIPASAKTDLPTVISQAKEGVVKLFVVGFSPDDTPAAAAVGSGFAVGQKGSTPEYFVTNWHVASAYLSEYNYAFDSDHVRIWIMLDNFTISDVTGLPSEATSVECSIVRIAESGYPDYAILRAARPVTECKPLPIRSSESVKQGETVVALGCPAVVDDLSATVGSNDITATRGTVARHMVMSAAGNTNVLLHDAVISGGNSGGPLIDENGNVIGLNTYGIVDSYSCAIYSEYVTQALDQMGIPYMSAGSSISVVTIAAAAVAVAAVAARNKNPLGNNILEDGIIPTEYFGQTGNSHAVDNTPSPTLPVDPNSGKVQSYQPTVSAQNPFIETPPTIQDYQTTKPVFPVDGDNKEETTSFDPVVGWLVCIEGATKGNDYRIHSQNNYIGRSAKMDISIPGDPHISAENSAIIAYDNEDRVFYFGPSTGRNIVRVNGKPALNAAQLEAYDVLTIGTTKLLFVPLCGDRFDWNEKK